MGWDRWWTSKLASDAPGNQVKLGHGCPRAYPPGQDVLETGTRKGRESLTARIQYLLVSSSVCDLHGHVGIAKHLMQTRMSPLRLLYKGDRLTQTEIPSADSQWRLPVGTNGK